MNITCAIQWTVIALSENYAASGNTSKVNAIAKQLQVQTPKNSLLISKANLLNQVTNCSKTVLKMVLLATVNNNHSN